MNNLSEAYRNVGKVEQALSLHEKTLQLLKTTHGPEHPNTLTSMGNLAATYRAAGKRDLALPLYEEVLQIHQRKSGPEAPATLTAMTTLFLAYEAARNFAQAERVGHELIARRTKTEGAKSVQVATAQATLGKVLIDAAKFAEAETLLRAALLVREEKIPDDWQTCNTRHLLGGALAGQGRFEKAEPLLVAGCEGMLRLASKIPASSRSRLRQALERTVAFYTKMKRSDQAAEWQKKLAEFNASNARPTATAASTSPDDAERMSLSNQDSHLKEEGRFEPAEPVGRRLLELVKKRDGDASVSIAYRQLKLAETLVMLEKFEEAESLARACIAMRQKLGISDEQLPWDRATLGAALVGQKRYAEADAVIIPACEKLRNAVGTKNPPGGGMKLRVPWLIRLYEATNRPEKAAEWQKYLDSL